MLFNNIKDFIYSKLFKRKVRCTRILISKDEYNRLMIHETTLYHIRRLVYED